MKNNFRQWIALTTALAVLLLCCASVLATQTTDMVEGQLLSVDPDAQTLVIRTADNRELKFMYNDETEVIGSENTAAGLATKEGSTVTVHYRSEGEAWVAVKIEFAEQSMF